ncbi:hypothetical protein HZP35_14165 [Elizabethkingia anophelis]|uniref:Phage gp6-like head-tail connector protein n=1 Tax=Elizabethkingia miricola TaxID=172045 RepID=A0ABD5B402_ELIMR|nr:hypothetical protein [Elizabethkingia miricola]MCT4156082.1 hypothetical protein [Elizabethkingia anophelis]MCT4170278.1 hypothetical protein [Elizabethkingia anophelis]MCT4244822.1 hypothetical protein [Elizabethkingia anophelis]MCT4248428.1 hypothetical protein [Elizabethkingia anophelis]MCT4259418.1 hypothetical protein [Elizabethkingia anophelis]
MKTLKERLRGLFDLTSKDETAEELYILLDDYISSVAVRLEREYHFKDFDTDEDLGGDCFIVPPSKGEFYVTHKGIYEVLNVTHVYDSSKRAGTIYMKKARQFKSAG